MGDVLLVKHPEDNDRNWATAEILNFQFDMALVPEFEMPDLSKVEFVLPEIQIAEDKVNDYINSLRDQLGERAEADKSTEKSILDIQIQNGDFTYSTKVTKKEFTAETVKLFDGQAVGYTEQIDFKTSVDERIFDKMLPKELMQHISHGPVSVTITGITDTKPAELNEDFYAKATRGEAIDSYEKFLEHIRSLFRNTYDEESDQLFKLQIKRKLPKLLSLSLAEDIILEQLKSKTKEDTDFKDIERDLPKIIDEIKYNLLTNKLLNDAGFKINDQMLELGAKKVLLKEFASMGLSGLGMDDQFLDRYVKTYLTSENGKNIKKVEEQLVTDKIAEIIKEKGNFVTKSVTIEELNQMVDDLLKI